MAKKKINYTPYIVGLGALAAVGFIFKDDIKKLFVKEDPLPEPEPTPVINTIVTPAGVVTQTKNVTQGLSGIGTPKDRLNLNQTLKLDFLKSIRKISKIIFSKIYKNLHSILISVD